jgi:hypothetical protein
VLRELGVSAQDTLAIGDAENDLALFEACGWAGCPENAVPAVRQRADWVFPGQGGEAVARAIRGPILSGSLNVPDRARHRIVLGWATGTAEVVSVPERGVNVLIHGDVASGKSWLAGALVERLVARGQAVCLIDPEGDYASLESLPALHRYRIEELPAVEDALEVFAGDAMASATLDLSRLPRGVRREAVSRALHGLVERRRRTGVPHWIVLDEAHEGLGADAGASIADRFEESGYCLVTYRPQVLHPQAWAALDAVLSSRTGDEDAQVALRRRIEAAGGDGTQLARVIEHLPRGQFAMTSLRGDGVSAVTFRPMSRETPHVRHRGKYVDARVPDEHAFYFRAASGRLAATAASLTELRTVLRTVDGDILAHHLARGRPVALDSRCIPRRGAGARGAPR